MISLLKFSTLLSLQLLQLQKQRGSHFKPLFLLGVSFPFLCQLDYNNQVDLPKSQKYKNTRNNYSKTFIVLGALKSLLCFPLDIDINDILNYRTNYLLRKCRKKAIANKYDCLSTRLLIVTFHEIIIKYESELETQLVLSDISTNHKVGLPRFLQFKFCQMVYLFKTFTMLSRVFI